MTDAELRGILEGAQTIAMVGASDNPERDSHRVMAYLLKQGYRVLPVNPTVASVQGQKCYPSLSAIPERVDIVDVFRRPDAVPAIVEETVAIAAPVVWLQLDVVNEVAAQTARDAGLQVVMDRCIKIEHQRLLRASRA